MMYKVGDRVKIVKKNDDDVYWNPLMDFTIGKQGIIINRPNIPDNCYRVQFQNGENWTYSVKCLSNREEKLRRILDA